MRYLILTLFLAGVALGQTAYKAAFIVNGKRLQIRTESGKWYAYDSTMQYRGDTLFLYGSDTIDISSSGDMTRINTTAGTIKLNKELTVPLSHGFSYFKDSSATVLVSSAGVYSKITNASAHLFNVGESDNMTTAGDSIILLKRGSYLVTWSFTLSGTNAKDFRIETQYNGVGQSGRMGASGSGAGNLFNIASATYIDNADSAGRIALWVTCITDGSDPVFKNGMVFIQRLY